MKRVYNICQSNLIDDYVDMIIELGGDNEMVKKRVGETLLVDKKDIKWVDCDIAILYNVSIDTEDTVLLFDELGGDTRMIVLSRSEDRLILEMEC